MKQEQPNNKAISNQKAWQYLRKLLNDDEKYFTLRTKKEPIQITGSSGGKYVLYPNGYIVGKHKIWS